MDIKVSARSKRASSQRGRTRHSNPKYSLKPVPAHQDEPPPNSTASSSLPSNWSRYEEEEALEVEPPVDLPVVKSKGADYRELLMQSSATSNFGNPDWVSGRKSLMLMRGMDLLSGGLDADTFWNRKQMSADEASFLSLDLDFLGNELANLGLAERLLIDPKFIPVEKRKQCSAVKREDCSIKAQDVNQRPLKSLTSDPDWTVPENYLMALSMPSRVLAVDSSLSKSSVSEVYHMLDDAPSLGEDSIGGQPGGSKSASEADAVQEITDSFQIHAHLKETTALPLMSTVSDANIVLDNLLCVTEDSINAQPESPKFGSEGVTEYLQTADTVENLKDTTIQFQNVDYLKLEAKAAEAELDDLLDMLDHHHLKDSATNISSTHLGSANGESPTSGEVGNSELATQAGYVMPNEDTFFGTLESSVESLDGISFNAYKNSEQGTMSGVTVSGQTLSFSTPHNGQGALNLDEDFDKWLDTL